jgi:L-alanine-DL-glutamate epimerase-like enolase superfamily enzyme
MSHSACKPVQSSVLGQTLDSVADVTRIGDLVRANSLDLLQADHILSGIDMAMWDLLGKRLNEPVYALLGYKQVYPGKGTPCALARLSRRQVWLGADWSQHSASRRRSIYGCA